MTRFGNEKPADKNKDFGVVKNSNLKMSEQCLETRINLTKSLGL